MSFSLPLDQMTTADKLRVIEEVWDDLCRNPADLPSPARHEEVLRKREARIESGEAEFIDWPQAKEDIRILPTSSETISLCGLLPHRAW